LVPGEFLVEPEDSGVPEVDAGTDAGTIADALPPLDVGVPPRDAARNPNCAEAGATLIYVVSQDDTLLSFYPPTATFTTIGTLRCPSPSQPFSMAVDSTGVAYVVYQDGELFRVSTATAACRSTAFVSGQVGFSPRFGMGFSQDSQGTGETLYLASSNDSDGTDAAATPSQLAAVDTTTFKLRIVGDLRPQILNAELTGTGAGDLFAFFATKGAAVCNNITGDPTIACPDSAIGQIDKTTGQVTNATVFRGVAQGYGWAFAFWGGDFYLFTAANDVNTVVYRYRPSDETLVQVATRPDIIVGAGVSTCAPAD
jgi:hypothetical protein